MIDRLLGNLKRQRLAWTWAVIVGFFLILLGHAPVLPVIAGCVLAIAISTLRSASKNQPPLTRLRGRG
jgi:hypothetical protein